MGVIAQYEISATNPSVVGGTGISIKYFGSTPTASAPFWGSSSPGVNSPADSRQSVGVPSATNALGQLTFPVVKFSGARFRIYASGSASSATTPTVTPIIQINTGTVPSPSYTTIVGGVASQALTANKPVTWSIAGDLCFDPINGTLDGFHKYNYFAVAGGTPGNSGTTEALLPSGAITGLNSSFVLNGTTVLFPPFGFVCGITFGSADPSNTANLYEFKIVQD